MGEKRLYDHGYRNARDIWHGDTDLKEPRHVPAQGDTDVQRNGPRGCFRAPAPASVMGRDLLCVDLIILQGGNILRICNVQIESFLLLLNKSLLVFKVFK